MGRWAWDPRILQCKSCLAVELTPGGVDSACHHSEVGKMSASLVVSCVGVATRPGLYPIAKETASAAPTLCTEYGPNGWMDINVTGFDYFNNLSSFTVKKIHKLFSACFICGSWILRAQDNIICAEKSFFQFSNLDPMVND